jgi:invasion protein IalB
MLQRASRPIARAAQLVARRGYAEEASSGRLKLSLVLPHSVRLPHAPTVAVDDTTPAQTIYNSSEVTQVNLSATSGDMQALGFRLDVV